MKNIDISDPSVDPKILWEEFCWWYFRRHNYFIEKACSPVTEIIFAHNVSIWSDTYIKSLHWNESIEGAHALVECWIQSGYLEKKDDRITFLQFSPKCGGDIGSA
jgi:hypothetical protein